MVKIHSKNEGEIHIVKYMKTKRSHHQQTSTRNARQREFFRLNRNDNR